MVHSLVHEHENTARRLSFANDLLSTEVVLSNESDREFDRRVS